MNLPINDELLLVILGSLVLVFFLIYMIYKESATTRKLKDYEFAIEELNRHIYLVEKTQKNMPQKEEIDVEAEIQRLLAKELKGLGETLIDSINEIKRAQSALKSNLEARMDRIEERTKEYLSVPSPASLDENRVRSLHKAGYSKEEIARELHANVSEVSFILNILNLTDGR
jgi:DNA invertase Pin-like site-specific DNA recombinase